MKKNNHNWNQLIVHIFTICFKTKFTNIKKAIIQKIFQWPFKLTVCFCHVTYAFQSKSTLYSCLNVKEILARSRRKIWSLSDCNWTWTHNHLAHTRTLNHLAKLTKLLSCVVSTYSQMHRTDKCSFVECSFMN